MAETLRQKQSRFVRMIVFLINKAHSLGYELTFGEVYRSPEEAIRRGFPNSLHVKRLAIDLNLFYNGKYLSSTESHKLLGDYWKSIGGTWGGEFGDGNHYSLEHNNVR